MTRYLGPFLLFPVLPLLLHCCVLPFLLLLTQLCPLNLFTPRQLLYFSDGQRAPLVLPSAKGREGIRLFQNPLMESRYLILEVSCFLMSVILRNSDKVGGWFQRLWVGGA